MSDQTALWIVIAVVALVVIAVGAFVFVKRRREGRSRQADELRSEAVTHAQSVAATEREAQRREAEAELARAEAQQAEARAAEAARAVQQTEARQEDTLREADRLDPAVDHKRDEYEPGPATSTRDPRDPPEEPPTTRDAT